MGMDQEYFDKQRERIKQRVKILLAKSDFVAEVKYLREKWSIPPGGLQDELENEKWQSILPESSDKYFDDNLEFEREKLDRLTKEGKLRERENEQKRFNDMAPLNAFHIDIEKLISKYKLPTDWHHPLERYLMFNDPTNMSIPINNATVQITWDSNRKMQLSILINANTTQKDIKFIWSDVMREQKRMNDRVGKKYQPIPNLDRDKRICELADQNTSYNDIATKIQEEFGEGDNFGFEDVSKALYRHRKRIGHK